MNFLPRNVESTAPAETRIADTYSDMFKPSMNDGAIAKGRKLFADTFYSADLVMVELILADKDEMNACIGSISKKAEKSSPVGDSSDNCVATF